MNSRSRSLLAIAATVSLATAGLLLSPSNALGSAAGTQGHAKASPSWQLRPTGTDEEYRGLSARSATTAWVSGENGSVLRTSDGGKTWRDVSPRQTDGMALRDIETFGDGRAVVLAIGEGEDSRIYRTVDGGRHWRETFRNTEPAAFYDCMAFGRNGSGLALSDPVDGRFQLARTTDRGRTWSPYHPDWMPTARTGEFAFAASGTCLVSGPDGNYWFASGGIKHPRVYHSTNGGRTWTVRATDLRGGPSAGIYSLDFRNASRGIAVGGDFADETNGADAAARSHDGGRTWTNSAHPVGGYRSGVAYLPGTANSIVAVGPTGSDVSNDGGNSWQTFDGDRYDGIQCAHDGSCWGSGTDGRVARLVR
jgi:photosystem II stability/assembly factor-like uncharacterized protein